jgi:exopolyphosphatase/guanosine-5'-triphosphate,3'-diphosphate pyrophosphatase
MRIGVFDLGTRAARLLVGDSEDLAFRKNFGQLTQLGEFFDEREQIRMEGLQRTIEVLRHFLREAEPYEVEQYVLVGTAALRKARNREAILDLLQDVLGIKMTILEEEEEAYLSLLSAFFHFQHEIPQQQPVLLIDQGGGSTEVSCGELDKHRFRFWGLASLELGSVLLKNLFLDNPRISVAESYRRAMNYIEREIGRHSFFPELQGRPPTRAFGMGSAITNITGVRGNRRQHGRVITIERMQFLINTRIDFYESNRMTVESFLQSAEDQSRQEEVERDLLLLYGLPVYQSLLRTYHLDRLTVCGYGLRYGVFIYLALPGICERAFDFQITPSSALRPVV